MKKHAKQQRQSELLTLDAAALAKVTGGDAVAPYDIATGHRTGKRAHESLALGEKGPWD
jgi:hypothetical protein